MLSRAANMESPTVSPVGGAHRASAPARVQRGTAAMGRRHTQVAMKSPSVGLADSENHASNTARASASMSSSSTTSAHQRPQMDSITATSLGREAHLPAKPPVAKPPWGNGHSQPQRRHHLSQLLETISSLFSQQ
jgi:hypothetical protein